MTNRVMLEIKDDKSISLVNCFDKYLCMVFGQHTLRESLRDIEFVFGFIRANSTTSESDEEYLVTYFRMLTK